MTRITVSVQPRHADNTPCDHPVKPSGKPRDPDSGCTGRAVYAVVCTTCGTVGEPHHLRVLADPAAANHREEHRLHANTPGQDKPTAQPEKEAAPQKQARARTNLDATK
ncbi:hypothetical protein B591_31133 (plasmid) [Streptomyces sp. GBA 94-10 4N24]|uniref:hypothetical protein n=1 Tax=Streptomyces TaxID=1883 RepID=UPI0003C31359|nr:hypothetical protein [Streptomyces sp. GBA 94-10 4N24]ESP95746.1 hypothetical protein B591_31133 [Streptomyces sp. GBA 94-10 4N24]UZN63206.1 hypothetical protein B591N_31133 [Streptomyces sp. GBA 94-10 4N24]